MRIDYRADKVRDKVAAFVATPEHHQLTHSQLIKLYKISSKTVMQQFFPAIGRLPQMEIDRLHRETMIADPMFGVAGERAPMTVSMFAERHGVGNSSIQRLRSIHGVLPAYIRQLKPFGLNGHQPTEKERAMYAICRLTHSWGRPKGMAEHIESLWR